MNSNNILGLLIVITLFFLSSCTQTDPNFGGKVPIKQVEEVSSRPVAEMYRRAGDKWIGILWTLEKVEKTYQVKENEERWKNYRLGLLTQEEYFIPRSRVGCLWLKEEHVRGANDILGKEFFTLDDRQDRRKSFDIFTVYNSAHNPNFESVTAINLLRPEADLWYKSNFALEFASLIKF